jgi:molybdopterin converting factor small subunit
MITVRLFGMTKSLADNQSSLTLALEEPIREKRYRSGQQALSQDRRVDIPEEDLVSVNQEIAHDDTKVQEGDEVALLPPFAGGRGLVSSGDARPGLRLQSNRREGGWKCSLGRAGENKGEVE